MASQHIPQSVARRIRKKAALGKAFVVVPKNGKPSRVFDLDKYLSKREATRKAQPWVYRKKAVACDPLGAIEGTVTGSVSRSEIYEE